MEARHQAIEVVRNGPGVALAFAKAEDFVAEAKQVLAEVSSNEAAAALGQAADHLVQSAQAVQATS